MRNQYRKSNFKLGCIHGKVPSSSMKEAQIRNHLYGAGILVIQHSAELETKIRLVGYEVPIWWRGKQRDECIDLLGYDEYYHPWIIELKQAGSTERLQKAVEQVTRYAIAFEEGIKEGIEIEIKKRYLWPQFSFEGSVEKMILADRKYYKKQKITPDKRDDIIFCSFSRCKDEDSLLKSRTPDIKLKIEKLKSNLPRP